MDLEKAIASIDTEIRALKQAKAALVGRGRPAKTVRKKRRLSPEGRARIVAAVKKRWAAQKKSES